jgi:hypothetical protein
VLVAVRPANVRLVAPDEANPNSEEDGARSRTNTGSNLRPNHRRAEREDFANHRPGHSAASSERRGGLLRSGALVRIAGLTGRPELNGARGRAVALNESSGRWSVKLKGRAGQGGCDAVFFNTSAMLALKPGNLVLVQNENVQRCTGGEGGRGVIGERKEAEGEAAAAGAKNPAGGSEQRGGYMVNLDGRIIQRGEPPM